MDSVETRAQRNAYQKKWYADHAAQVSAQAKERYRIRKRNAVRKLVRHGMTGTVEYSMWVHAHERAKKLNLPFDIDVADIVIPQRCPIFGVELKGISHSRRA